MRLELYKNGVCKKNNNYKTLRDILLGETFGCCAYCGTSLVCFDKGDLKYEKGIQIDHILCRSKYEKTFDVHDEDNLTVSCRNCNAQKKDLGLFEFLYRFEQKEQNMAVCDPRKASPYFPYGRIKIKMERAMFKELLLIQGVIKYE